jgi:predicted RNA polymerase sigma factor
VLVTEHFFREDGARLVATLTANRGTHQLQLAEDVVQEALVRALQTWPYRGVHGAKRGIAALDAITDRSKLETYHLFHVIRGTFAAELGNTPAALTHFRQAGNLASLPAERDFIARRIRECEAVN